MRRAIMVAAVVSVAAIGCASARPPTARIASTQAAIRSAEEIGAPSIPRAALHLKYARDQVAQANGLMREGEVERAEEVLIRAQIDAELALVLARQHVAEAEAGKANEEVMALRLKAQQ